MRSFCHYLGMQIMTNSNIGLVNVEDCVIFPNILYYMYNVPYVWGVFRSEFWQELPFRWVTFKIQSPGVIFTH